MFDNQDRGGEYTETVPVPAGPAVLSPRRKWATAFIVCVGAGMLCLDTAVVNTALPSIDRDLHAGLSGLQWVVDAYTLALAAVVLTMGSIGDRRGRRRVFAAGMVVFTAASLASALAPNIGFLDGSRVMDTFRYAGIAVGVAAFGALLPAGGGLGHGSAEAFVTGFRHAVFVGGAVTLVGAVAVLVLIGARRARAYVTSPETEELADAPAAPGR